MGGGIKYRPAGERERFWEGFPSLDDFKDKDPVRIVHWRCMRCQSEFELVGDARRMWIPMPLDCPACGAGRCELAHWIEWSGTKGRLLRWEAERQAEKMLEEVK